MAVKTITIDMQAYEMLSRRKREGQSFSQVIKEHFAAPRTGRDLKKALEQAVLSPETLDAVEQVVNERGRDPARSVEL